MVVQKVVTGFVIQQFDTDTKKFISQEFVCGDEFYWEDEMGNPIEGPEETQYLPYEMKQPEQIMKEGII
jgi:hypothetical protein